MGKLIFGGRGKTRMDADFSRWDYPYEFFSALLGARPRPALTEVIAWDN